MTRLMLALGVAGLVTLAGQAQTSYVPHRVFDSSRAAFADFETMLADLSRADVVLVGEQHDDPNTHRLEVMLLHGLARRRPALIVSMEMFERDAQASLDRYLAGTLAEDEFLKASRPWPAYKTDYKPIVDLAKEKHWPVVAANVPRALATEVSRSGASVLRTKPPSEQALAAAELKCPQDDDYFRRFEEAMGGHTVAPGSGQTVASARQSLERFYDSQCVKDETMAESIARAWQSATASGDRPLVVHYNGAFHSDYTEGTAERVIRRLPGKRVAVISVLPVEDLDKLTPNDSDRKRADYLVYTIK